MVNFNNILNLIAISLRSIKGQLLRTVLTIMIIAVGITAMVGILTAIDAIKYSISDNFSSMGSNTFTIKEKYAVVRGDKSEKDYPLISFAEASRFSDKYNYPAVLSTYIRVSWSSTVKFKSKKTNPNVQVYGTDMFYLETSGYKIENGRNFNKAEILNNNRVVLVGSEIVNNLFTTENPIGQTIDIGGGKYKIIGVLEEKGSSGSGGDRVCMIPINIARQQFTGVPQRYWINVMTNTPQDLDPAISEATGLFRIIRQDPLKQEDSFIIRRSDRLALVLIENLQFVTIAATVIGIITLLGAAIGLMNIMLVSVTERTREIGVRKAMGAKISAIRYQFLTEAMVICQIGGLLGIVLGILIGNGVAMLVGSTFFIPWFWIMSGVVLCFFVGVLAGFYPAQKAANLNPIDALRYE